MIATRTGAWARALAVIAFAAAGALAQPPEAPSTRPAGAAPRFEIAFDPSVSDQPYTGRVYVMLAGAGSRGEPSDGPNWFGTQPFYAQDVKDWKPGEPLRLDPETCLGYPAELAQLPAGEYRVQAVIDLNGWARNVIRAEGNGCSRTQTFTHDAQNPPRVELRITDRFPSRELKDTDDVKFIRLRSELLSRFHGRDVFLQAAVGLPAGYADDPERRYPSIYMIPGFGGNIDQGAMMLRMMGFGSSGFEIVQVYLDPDCPLGHHVFADSASNGPVGEALVKELIPYLEQRFRIIRDSRARYVTGQSSGGWSSLWLQVTYPETFGGVWSLAPDPVDFSAFQLTNIYDPTDNMFYERDGSLRPLSRSTRRDQLLARNFCHMEEVLGRGGQLQSFEAVFSPRGPDGKPAKLWDRATGKLDPTVAEAWKKYDISLILRSNWSTLGPKLPGKLRIICGDQDTFYLERAVLKLRDTLTELKSDAQIEIIPGAGHGLTRQVWSAIPGQVRAQFERCYLGRADAATTP
jgi:hypothetical protein